MKAELGQLIRLQEADIRIQEIQTRIQSIPQQITDLEHKLNESRESLERAEARVEELRSGRRGLEVEVEDLRQKCAKYKGQLMEVKSNKEYQAVLIEIATAEKSVSEREDEILERMLALDDAKEERESAHAALKAKQAEIAKKRGELESFVESGGLEVQHLTASREELLEIIPPALLVQYRRIAAAHGGRALAEAKDQSCQACHVKLRPQVFAEVRRNNVILHCDSCRRILYYVPPGEVAAAPSPAAS